MELPDSSKYVSEGFDLFKTHPCQTRMIETGMSWESKPRLLEWLVKWKTYLKTRQLNAFDLFTVIKWRQKRDMFAGYKHIKGLKKALFNGTVKCSHSGLSGWLIAEIIAISINYLSLYNPQLSPQNGTYEHSLILFSAEWNRITHCLVMLQQLTSFRSGWEVQHHQLSNGNQRVR